MPPVAKTRMPARPATASVPATAVVLRQLVDGDAVLRGAASLHLVGPEARVPEDGVGVDDVHAYAEGRRLDGEHAGELELGGLGRAVGAEAGAGRQRVLGGDE